MTPYDERKKKLINELANTIVEMMSEDDDVLEILQEMASAGMIDKGSMLGLGIKLTGPLELSGYNLGRSSSLDYMSTNKCDMNLKPFKLEGAQVIDGKVLTPNEMAFEEHCAILFDDDKWLKLQGLKWDIGGGSGE